MADLGLLVHPRQRQKLGSAECHWQRPASGRREWFQSAGEAEPALASQALAKGNHADWGLGWEQT